MVKAAIQTLTNLVEDTRVDVLDTAAVPTPTAEYRTMRKLTRAATAYAAPAPVPLHVSTPLLSGPRVLLWKQDPTVSEIGIRKAFIPSLVSSGPKDTRIQVAGIPSAFANAMGDFIQAPLTPEFDGVHTFAVVRMTLTMFQRALATDNSLAALPWQWNNAQNSDPITVFPRHSTMMNAFYSREDKVLAFGFFPKPGTVDASDIVFTCRSFDIVAHECGHAILDGMKPRWLDPSAPAQTAALHEAFGDLTAIFLTLSQIDQVEAVIAQTKSNLHDKTFLSDMAEEFGLALGRTNGLRNADNDLRLSQVGTEVHALSQVFTGALYDILADIFSLQRTLVRDDAVTLYEAATYLRGLLLRAVRRAPDQNAGFADVANALLAAVGEDAEHEILEKNLAQAYRKAIRNRFMIREVILAPTATPAAFAAALQRTVANDEVLTPAAHESLDAGSGQNRGGCCGTMTLPAHNGIDEAIEKERALFRKRLKQL